MKSFFDLRENKQITEAVKVSRKDFDKLKKGSMITIDYGSSVSRSNKRTFMVKGKSRSAKYNVDKINMVDPQKPGGMKFHLYSRNGEDATLALGDMGATINSYSIKEEVEQVDESIVSDYKELKAKGKRDSAIIDIMMSMSKYRRMNRDQLAKKIGDAKRKGMFREKVEEALKTSDYPKGTSMSAQKFKDSQKKMSKQRALTTKDYPKGTSMSATAWKNKQEEVELDERSREDDIKKTISIMKKYPANKNKSEKELRKGAIAYLDQYKKEEVDEAKVRGADAYDKTFANRKQADKFAREMGGRVKQVGRVFYVFKESVDEASILRTKTTRKQSDASKEKDRKKAVKTFQDIRKGKYPGVKFAEETLDEKFSFIVRDKDGKIAGGSSSEREAKMMASRIKGKVQPLKKPISNKQLDNMKVMGESVELDEASIQDIQGILTTIAKSQNMNQAVQMVMKKYKVDQGKAKAMVKKAIDSGVTYDKIKKKYAK